ncbi:BUD13 homolog [Anopheles stephensi]|uniref:BUD13 homolog n=1 Tax=Anopheles stephensi TaxID=30069 RepID=UPI0016588DE5|nr:BUD13 homolog [Anopheles stephensi]
MAPKIDQKEYLKRYLSNDKDKKKKKKKKDKKVTKPGNVVIVDDDLDLTELQKRMDADETDLFGLDEEAPLVVGIIDERPPELRAKEDFSSTKWKAVANSFDSMVRESNRAVGASENGANRRRKDSDESPPRRTSKEKESLWGKATRHDSDESPPRRKGTSHKTDRRGKDTDESPPRRRSKERDGFRGKANDSDESPPRKSSSRRTDRRGKDSDESPPRRKSKKDKDSSREKGRREDSDESPPSKSASHRTERRGKDSDESPPRRRSKEKEYYRAKVKREDSDEIPPRKERGRHGRREDSDESPPRKRKQREDCDRSSPRKHRHSDRESPPRRRKDFSSNRRRDSDESPPRRSRPDNTNRRRNDSDESPPRRSRGTDGRDSSARRPTRTASPQVRIKQEKHSSDYDLSPPRKRDSDESPPRRRAATNRRRFSKSPDRRRRDYREIERRIKQEPRSPSQRRNEPPERMSKTLDGKRAGLQDAASLREENEKHRARERDALMKMSDDVSGRYADTVVRDKSGRRRDVEKELREELAKRKEDEKKKEVYSRWGKGVKQAEDYKAQLQEAAHEMEKPLARYADDKDLDEYLKQQERDGDPMLEYLRSKQKEENKRAGIPEKPLYQGAFPDNRFGIRPGYRWDGVDRSNGFEKSWFETTSKKKAGEEEAYKYSVEDM